MNDKKINWLHPDLLEQVKEWIPGDVYQINPHTYEIFGATFIVAEPPVTLVDMIGFLVDNGWQPDNTEQEQTE